MPTSYWCTPVTLPTPPRSCTPSTGPPGVLTVTEPPADHPQRGDRDQRLQVGLPRIAIILIISAAVLILNTIRMAIFARRREVSVMKLVGATNWFIRVPFMSEGMIQGLLGSVLAAPGRLRPVPLHQPRRRRGQRATS